MEKETIVDLLKEVVKSENIDNEDKTKLISIAYVYLMKVNSDYSNQVLEILDEFLQSTYKVKSHLFQLGLY